MNAKLFSEAMNEVDNKYYVEAENYHGQKQRYIKLTSLAACAAIVAAAVLGTLWKTPGQTMPQPGYDPPIITSPDDSSNHTEQAISLNVNEIEEPNVVSGNIALGADDFTAMSYEDMLTYFDTSLPIPETLPYLTLRSETFGIFQQEDHDIYYDGNFVVFQSSDGTQSINIDLSKVNKHTYDAFILSADELKFTEINGRELAVFHYTDENGADCYYTEFLQNDVAFMVGSENISAEDYGKCLQVLVEKAPQGTGSVHTITGEVTAITHNTNSIWVLLDEDEAPEYSRRYEINLPSGYSAEGYSMGDCVEVTYRGEPATICTIWAEQFVDIKSVP